MKKEYHKLIAINLALGLSLFFSVPAHALSNQSAVAERQTLFNDITDSIATMGASDQEKKEIRRERHNIRKAIRLENLGTKKNKAVKKQMERQNRAIMRRIKEQKQAQADASRQRNRRLEKEKKLKQKAQEKQNMGGK